MKKKSNRGGKRSNAGRKKVADPKVQLTIYIEKSKIEKAGGMEQAKIIAYQSLSFPQ